MKSMELEEFFEIYPEAALAFSGGTDSAYLLYEAARLGRRTKAYFVKSQFQPDFELADARKLAEQLGAELQIIELDVLSFADVVKNTDRRCYYCKKEVFGKIKECAEKDGFSAVMDGTNASDDAADRPGMQALEEMRILSPLRMCGLTKEQIRQRSKEAGLFTWDRPSYACLATRIQTGTAIDEATLKKVESAEKELHRMGFSDFRVRIFHGAARIQLTQDQIGAAMEKRDEIISKIKPYFSDILLDLETR